MIEASGTFRLDGETTVHRLGFGAMRLCGPDVLGPPDDEAAARGVAEHALELGVDFIDTADSYGPGVSERLLRAAGAPDRATVATKGGLLRTPDGGWHRHAPPDYLRNQALVSRDRLGVETIDLYQLHAPDPDVPFEASVTALADLRDEGLVRHVGLSNVTVEQLETAREHVPVATVQNRYNVANRADDDVLAACEAYDVGFVPWYPLAAGELDGVEAVGSVAAAHDATPHQVALAWLLARSPVTLPIPGTSEPSHLAENVAAAGLELTDAEVAALT